MEIGGPCEAFFGWTLLAIREPCPIHGCDRYDVRSTRQRLLNRCPQCYREKAKKARGEQYARRRSKGEFERSNYVASHPHEGMDIGHPKFWNAQYDRNITKFWAKRGMTDEDAKLKFGFHLSWEERKKRGLTTSATQAQRILGLPTVRFGNTAK